jgi:hypothetical protein
MVLYKMAQSDKTLYLESAEITLFQIEVFYVHFRDRN